MDLFVIQREEDEGNKITEEEEKRRLDKILKQIEKRKLARQRLKDRKKEKLPQKSAHKEQSVEENAEIPAPDHKIAKFIEPKLPELKPENFTILGVDNLQKKAKVKRVLPKWLTNPTVISSNLQQLELKVSKLKLLDPEIRRELKKSGIKYFFPVQAEVIPWLLQVNQHIDVVFPRDICVSAPTGSGKTLAFVLPLVQALKRHTVRRIRALVILPTQDLAAQVFKTFKIYSRGTNLETCLITGKNVFSLEQKQLIQQNKAFGYVSKVDILVCTAGRLVDHLKLTPGFDLKFLEFLVIDEADRVLENVQDDWLYHLEKHIQHDGKVLNLFSLQKRRPPQKLLFSATLSQDPEKLQKLSLFQPKLFTSVVEDQVEENESTFIGKYTTPLELTEKYTACSKDLKPLVLYKFIKTESLTKTLIFTHSVESAHRLSILLRSLFKDKLKIEEISSKLRGQGRDGLIDSFSKGEIDLLICTDALARGIDFPGVKCVVSYSAPKHLKTYIHRAGRTARAGETGLALTLLHKEQVGHFKSLLKQSKKTNIEELGVSEEDLETLSKLYEKALKKLRETVKSEEQSGLKKLMTTKKKMKNKKKV